MNSLALLSTLDLFILQGKKMADNKAIPALRIISKCRGPTVLFEKGTVGPLYFDNDIGST